MNPSSRRLRALPFLLAGGVLAACSSADDGTALSPPAAAASPSAALDAADIADLELRAERVVAAGVPGVSVAVIAGEQTVLVSRGLAERATGEPLTSDHRFRVASMAKSLLASIVLQLVEEGRLSLGDRVDQWLPGMLHHNGDASIENLLRLESGIFNFEEDERHMAPYRAGDFSHYWSPEELVALADSHPAVFPPGARFHYSNTNYVLLALIIEKITGASLAEVVRQRITDPLGMSGSSMPTGSALQAPYAHGYQLGLGPEPVDVTAISASSVFGNGNLVATAHDVALFYGALARGEVVSAAQLPAMFTPSPAMDTHYGMGVWRFDHELPTCGRFVGHDGAVPGYDVTAFSNLEGTRQYAVLVNVLAPGDVVGDEVAQAAFRELVEAAGCNGAEGE